MNYQGKEYTETTLEEQQEAHIEWALDEEDDIDCETMICISLKEFNFPEDPEHEAIDFDFFYEWVGDSKTYQHRMYPDVKRIITSVDTRYIGHDDQFVYIFIEFNIDNH